MPSAVPPTAAPAAVATSHPAATTGPTPGIASNPSPVSNPTTPPAVAPIPAPVPAPSARSSTPSRSRSTVAGPPVVLLEGFAMTNQPWGQSVAEAEGFETSLPMMSSKVRFIDTQQKPRRGSSGASPRPRVRTSFSKVQRRPVINSNPKLATGSQRAREPTRVIKAPRMITELRLATVPSRARPVTDNFRRGEFVPESEVLF